MQHRYVIVVFWSDEDAAWIADIPDLKSCSAFGDSPEEAVAEVRVAMDAWAARDAGLPLPEPSYHPQHEAAEYRYQRRFSFCHTLLSPEEVCMEITLDGRAAIVTGGSKGIGFAIATRFAASGADVAIIARGREALDQAVKTIGTTAKGRIIGIQG